jgi:hypothetical protein
VQFLLDEHEIFLLSLPILGWSGLIQTGGEGAGLFRAHILQHALSRLFVSEFLIFFREAERDIFGWT